MSSCNTKVYCVYSMAKTKSNRKNGNKRGNWSNTDHEYRTAKRIASLNKKRRRQQQQLEQSEANDDQQQSFDNQPTKKKKQPHHELPIHQIRLKKKVRNRNQHNRLTLSVDPDAYKRSHLAHDNYDQIDSTKLRLATAQIQRKVNTLKQRLESWDPVAESKLAKLQSNEQYEDKNSIEYKMKLHTHNTTLDKVARAKAHDEYNLLYAKHGVNSSTNRRKANLRSKPRPGPESWKLRGAARPAHEVYDFDVRYVDKHILAHTEANEIARRSINVLVVCKGRFAVDNGDESVDEEGDGNNINQQTKEEKKQFQSPQPYCREYLSLLTQLASLHLHRNNYSSARSALLECINLEGPQHSTSITNARYQLMNMYLHTNRPSSARKLSNLLINDNSAWIKYSMALIEYISWNLLNEEGSTSSTAEDKLKLAIRGNVYVVYLLAFSTTFEKSMEYTNEVCIEHELESNSCSLLEAIEYGCNCYNEGEGDNDDEGKGMDKGMALWMSTEGSLDWVRSVVLRVLNEDDNSDSASGNEEEDRLTKADLLSWESKLNKEEEVYEKERNEKEQKKLALKVSQEDGKIDYGKDTEDDEDDLDVVMYAGMFRTAMDWLSDAGELLKSPNYDYIIEQPNNVEEEEDANEGGVAEEEEKVAAERSSGSTSGSDSDEESKSE